MLVGKKYMFSTTWNAPYHAFNDKNSFFEGKDSEDIIFHLHLSHKYAGMEALKTFSCYNVKKNPDLNLYLDSLEKHLGQYFKI